MAKKIAVKLNPISTKMVVRNDSYKVVTGASIALENSSNGTSTISNSDQSATIDFFEAGDNKTPIASLAGTIKLDAKGNPVFDLNSATFTNNILDNDTDFHIELDFSTKVFSGKLTLNGRPVVLNLPWVVRNLDLKSPKASNLTVGAQLSIAGNLEAPAFKDKLDIPFLHKQVPEETASAFKNSLIGPGNAAYPIRLLSNETALLRENQTIPRAGTTFEVLLHDSLRSRCEAISAGSFLLDTLTANIQMILATGGFDFVVIKEVPAADPSMAVWRFASDGTGLISKNAKEGDTHDETEGHLVPFFQFLIHSAARDSGAGNELAHAEILNPVPGHAVNVAAKQKRIIRPICFPTNLESAFRQTYVSLKDPLNCTRLLALTICHEIGHGLGLMHPRVFDPNTKSYSTAGSIGMMANVIIPGDVNDPRAPALPLSKAGPVHAAVIKHHYP